MSARDQDLLDKLFEVEKKAETLVSAAKAEADSRLAAAKGRAEIEYTEVHEKALKEGGLKKAAAVEAAIIEYDATIASYRSSLDATACDEKAFRAACEAALSKK